MNLSEIKEIVNNINLSKDEKEYLVISSLSKDELVIPTLLKILEKEREFKKQLIVEMNLLLGKADVGLDDSKYNKDGFMQKEILAFYKKYKGIMGHCFKNLNHLI